MRLHLERDIRLHFINQKIYTWILHILLFIKLKYKMTGKLTSVNWPEKSVFINLF